MRVAVSADTRTRRSLKAAEFISADHLAALLARSAPVLLLDVRFTLEKGPLPEEYMGGHIPGAIFVDLEHELTGPRIRATGSYPLPEPGCFQDAARSWGLDRNTEVVAYGGYTGVSAGRLAWLLRWFGHERVRVLDGGLRAWLRRGYPSVSQPSLSPRAYSGNFTASAHNTPIIDSEGALELGRQGQLVDSRAAGQFLLRTPDPSRGGRAPGRIPGAVNIPSTSLHHRSGQLRSADEIAALLASKGVDPNKPVGIYCGGAVASAWAAFALQSAGIDAALFTASWSEYVADPSLPVEVEPPER